MHPDHQQQFRLLGWDQRDHEAVARSMIMMGARSRAGFHQGAGVPQHAVNLRPCALPGRL